MVEAIERRGLLIPELKPAVTNLQVSEMFGSDYRERITRRAAEFGIDEPLRFFDSPKPHEGSQALYLAEQFAGDSLVLVSVLGRGMKTSKHHHEHPMGSEFYLHIAGESFISINGNTLALNNSQDRIEVPLRVSHQVEAKDSASLTLIIMKNARLVPPHRLHIKD